MSLFVHVPTRRPQWCAALRRRLPARPIVESITAARHALIWKPPPGLFARAHALEAVFALGAGVERLLADPDLAPALPLIRLHDAGMAAQMVDYHIYAALHFQREFDVYARDQAAARWAPRSLRPRLRVGVLGLGAIGASVATALAGLGFEVHGWSRRAKTLAGVEVYSAHGGLEPCLRRSELLICLLPHTPATVGLLDASRLAALPRGAALINAGRGSLIDEAALRAALDGEHLRGAMLDVSAVEPLPPRSWMWRHPRLQLTPHIAAETLIEPAVEQIAAGIAALEAGHTPAGLVDRHAGY